MSKAVYESLMEAISAPVENKTLSLPTPCRPSIRVRYNTNITHDALQRYIKVARTHGGKSKDIDTMKLATLLLGSQCEAFEMFDGDNTVDVVDAKTGDVVTFNDKGFQGQLGVLDGAPGAIRKFYGRDADVLAVMQHLLEEAGYGDTDLEDTDPLVG